MFLLYFSNDLHEILESGADVQLVVTIEHLRDDALPVLLAMVQNA